MLDFKFRYCSNITALLYCDAVYFGRLNWQVPTCQRKLSQQLSFLHKATVGSAETFVCNYVSTLYHTPGYHRFEC